MEGKLRKALPGAAIKMDAGHVIFSRLGKMLDKTHCLYQEVIRDRRRRQRRRRSKLSNTATVLWVVVSKPSLAELVVCGFDFCHQVLHWCMCSWCSKVAGPRLVECCGLFHASNALW